MIATAAGAVAASPGRDSPLSFIENRGQISAEAAYHVQGSNKSLYFTSTGVTIALIGERGERWVVKLDFVGANPKARPRGEEPGETSIRLDTLDWIHAITTQIPEPRQHLVRYFGAYSNRARGAARRRPNKEIDPSASLPQPLPRHDPEDSDSTGDTKASWARLLGKLFEVDPCLCPRCGDEMRIVAVITEPEVVDRILWHIAQNDIRDPFQEHHDRASRAPPNPLALRASTSA